MLCRAALDGRALDLVEIDAASNRGIDQIRDLREKVAFHPSEGRYRLYIFDEAHELTSNAWDALLKTLEEPPPHAMFVLATTEAHAIPPTIVSRCQRFDFRRIPFQVTREQLRRVAEHEGMRVDPAVLERLALVARGGLRDALSLLDQLEAFAGGDIDMTVARAALSLPSIEAVRGVIDGMTRRDPGAVMTLLSDAAEGGADLRLFAEELVVHLRALLLLAARADAKLGEELPEDEVSWLRERASTWNRGALMRLIQTLSDALARTRDAQQFQVQTEVALLTACDIDTLPVAAAPAAQPPAPEPPALEPPAPEPPALEPPALEASPPTAPAPVPTAGDGTLRSRWPDVIDIVKTRNPILASLLGSAHPLHVQDNLLTVAFGTDFNRKSAEKPTHRQIIETAFERVYGTAYRLRCTVKTDAESGASLLDDPVINYATRTFGGQPKRVAADQPS
jgi:DNA polymerase-3 subunit gamma/tau